ncbi:hypothetical protein BDR07DRAFT_189941 [Suillus spraguei]|nr:hypothetical protein BDR07DRAFT_189941 [Suillus spraguei]
MLRNPLELQARLPRCHSCRMYNQVSSNLDLCYLFLATWPLVRMLNLIRLRLVLTTAEITLRRRSIRFLPYLLPVFSYDSLPLSRPLDLYKLPGNSLKNIRITYPAQSPYLSFCRFI